MRKLLATLAMISAATLVNGQKYMSLDECVNQALETNKQIDKSEKTYEKQSEDAESYKTNRLPKLSLVGGYMYSNSAFDYSVSSGYLPTFSPDATTGQLSPNVVGVGADGSYIYSSYAYFPGMDLDLNLKNIATVGITLEQPIYMGGKINSAIKMSEKGKEMADMNRQLVRNDVIVQTNDAYFKLVKVIELQKVAEKYKEVVTELYNDVQNAYEIGMRSQNDVLKVKTKLNEAELKVRQTENGVKVAKMNLCHTIGIPLDSDVMPEDSIIVLELDTIPGNDISKRVENTLLDKKIELKTEEQKIVESDFKPQVALVAGASYLYGPELNDEQLFNDISFGAGITVNVPLFHWGEGKSKSKSIQIEKEELEIDKADITEKMQMELALALNSYDEALLEVELTKSSLEQAEENLRVSKDMYDIGKETLANHLEAQTTWTKANTDYINAKGDLQNAKTKVLKASGNL